MKVRMLEQFEKLLKFLRITTPRRAYWFMVFLISVIVLIFIFAKQEATGKSFFDSVMCEIQVKGDNEKLKSVYEGVTYE